MNINALDLNLLKVFAALHETRKQTLAADKLGLSQPALSHALRRLQATFSDELFLRQDGSYEPTRKAQSLITPILEALQTLETALAETENFCAGEWQGRLSIAVSDYASSTLLPPLCQEMSLQAPGVDVVVSQLSYDGFATGLKSGEIDVAITSQPADTSMIRDERILRETAVYIARTDHPDLGALGALEGFVAANHVIVNLYGQQKSWLDARLAELGVGRRVQMVVPYFNAVPGIVARTDLVGGLPRRLAQEAKRDFPVEMFELPLEFPPIDFYMCWNAHRQREAPLTWFRRLIRRVSAKL